MINFFYMKLSLYRFIFYFFLTTVLSYFPNILLSQRQVPQRSCTPPSEQELGLLLQEIISTTQHQGLQIGGVITGAFSQKEQMDCVLWLKEQTTKGTTTKRQIFKLVCQQSQWQIVGQDNLPPGIHLSERNFIDVTGDGLLELVYSFSYVNQQCIDGCAIASFQQDHLDVLYQKSEQHHCQDIDWSLYQQSMGLPFIRYQLNLIEHPTEPYIIEKRFVKKFQGGHSQETVIQQASIDSSSIQLFYHQGSKQFIEPIQASCNALAFENNVIDIRHPAVRLAHQHINKNAKQYFDIEGVYKANFSNKDQIDYLFYTNTFQHHNQSPVRRKAIKIVCDGLAWKIAGILYVSEHFSAQHIVDVNGDGIDEIIDEQIQPEKNGCTKTYRILSFQSKVGQLIYSHKNRYTSCTNQPPTPSPNNGTPIGLEYTIHFEDVDNDGVKELIQTSGQEKHTFVYNSQQNRYILER